MHEIFVTRQLLCLNLRYWKISVNDKILVENVRKGKEEIYPWFPSQGNPGVDFMLAKANWCEKRALTSFALYDQCRSFAAYAKQLLVSQNRLYRAYLIPTDNMTVLVWHFNWKALIRFYSSVGAYFLSHPVGVS